jgi:hypothetical protein
LLASIAAGDRRVALAEPEPGDELHVRVTDFGDADLLLVLDGATMSLIDTTNVEFISQTSFDPLVPLATAAVDLTRRTDGSNAVQCSITEPALALRATVLSAAELAGIARATSERSTEYVKDREQFDRPVGSFQAVKHRCADMAVRADAAVQLTRLASLAVAGDHQDASFQAEAARVVAAEAAVTNAEINVQNHGGIGFTYEHTAHRYVTRARVRAGNTGGRSGHLAAMLAAGSPT